MQEDRQRIEDLIANHKPGYSLDQHFYTDPAIYELENDRIIMKSPADGMGQQRVVFSDFTPDTFAWASEFSRDDGETWVTVMRVRATRLSR